MQIRETVQQQGWYMPGIQVLQILAWPLQQRARVFPSLPSHSQVYPGFFDAPGSACALLPESKRGDHQHKQAVTIAFCSADKSVPAAVPHIHSGCPISILVVTQFVRSAAAESAGAAQYIGYWVSLRVRSLLPLLFECSPHNNG